MKEKQWDPARHNEQSPEPGMAAVNTHNPEETPIEEIYNPENAQQEESRQHEGSTTEHAQDKPAS